MDSMPDQVRQANGTLDAVIDRVCGACENSCCHQGTMMGSQDLRRLYKGLRLEPGREQILRSGLRKRGQELAADLEVVRKVLNLIRTSLPDCGRGDIQGLEERITDWQDFCDNLMGEIDLSYEGLSRLLFFSAIRSNCLRTLRQFEGAQSALVNFSRGVASFRLSGRRIAAPRCLFHYGGCLAGRWKPVKCANFFCTGTPNVLKEIANEMSFDDFVLGNCTVLSADEVTEAVQLELDLGRKYVEPKIVVGLSPAAMEQLTGRIEHVFERVMWDKEAGPFMWSTHEARDVLGALPETEALVAVYHTAGGAALYELAVALDGLRAAGTPPAFYLFIDHIAAPSPLAHPLWADEMMSQPLGGLDLYVIE